MLYKMSLSEIKSPNFFLLGATKSGTTSLHYYLEQHPELFLTKQKEPHFFDSDLLFKKGYDWYLNEYFKKASGHKYSGEATPNYFHLPDIVIPRMKSAFGVHEPKFVVILRNPVDRCWSHYLHRVRKGTEKENLYKALELENDRLLAKPSAWHGYYRDGLYGKLISKWFDQFSKSNFLFLFYEELNNVETLLSKIFSFLEIDSDVKIETNIKKNIASEARSEFLKDWINGRLPAKNIALKPLKYIIRSHTTQKRVADFIKRMSVKPLKDRKPEIPEELRRTLLGKYKSDIIQLQELVNRDLAHWLSECLAPCDESCAPGNRSFCK